MDDDSSLLDKLYLAVPAPLTKFDAFPKLPWDQLYLSGLRRDGVNNPASDIYIGSLHDFQTVFDVGQATVPK